MNQQLLIAGGGIGALAAGLVASRAGWQVRLFEQAPAFSEVGAGLQLGPNASRLLYGWGLGSVLERVASFPEAIVARSSASGRELARLGRQGLQRHGAPYATLHRRDLHELLLRALQAQAGVELQLHSPVVRFVELPESVQLTGDGWVAQGAALIGADGLWSRVREQLLHDGPAQATGHLAYRALIPGPICRRAFRRAM